MAVDPLSFTLMTSRSDQSTTGRRAHNTRQRAQHAVRAVQTPHKHQWTPSEFGCEGALQTILPARVCVCVCWGGEERGSFELNDRGTRFKVDLVQAFMICECLLFVCMCVLLYPTIISVIVIATTQARQHRQQGYDAT